MSSHKTLMTVVIVLAVVHMLLSALVGGLVLNGKLENKHVASFCFVSVFVNIIIIALAAACLNQKN